MVLCIFAGCTQKTYTVDYCGEKQMYDGAQDSFAPGTTVTLRYTLISSDTDYAFYLDGEKLSVDFDSNKGYFIRFTMPDHNVRLECVTKNTMTSVEGETSAAETENAASTEIPPQTEPVKEAVKLLTLSKSFCQQCEWDNELLLALSEYSGAVLSEDSRQMYPALTETLDQVQNMMIRSMEDEYDNLLVTANEELAFLGNDSFVTKVSTLDTQIRRADSVAVSVLSDSYLVYGNINGRYLNGTTYDTETGSQLKITDVITDMDKIPAIVKEELQRHMWNGEFYSETAVEEYFRNTPVDGIRWTLDYNGVTFYFLSGEIASGGNGHLAATVSFSEYPALFNEKYTKVPDAYIVELPLQHSFFTDLDGDGDTEELFFVPFTHENGLFYESFGIYTDTDAYYYYTEFSANMTHRTGGYHPYYVKTADGRHYVYVFAEGSELAAEDMQLCVIDVTGGEFKEVGNMHISPGYIPIDCSYALTDPENMLLENFANMTQSSEIYRVGDDGMPVLQEFTSQESNLQG